MTQANTLSELLRQQPGATVQNMTYRRGVTQGQLDAQTNPANMLTKDQAILLMESGTDLANGGEFDLDGFLDYVETKMEETAEPTVTELRNAIFDAAMALADHKRQAALTSAEYNENNPHQRLYDALVSRLRAAAK